MASTASLRLLERRLRLLAVLTVFFGVVVTAGLCLRTPATVTTLDPFVDAPLKDMVILVDPGHGGYDGGARAQDSGVWEKEINLAVALQVEKALTARGASVTLTRREDIALCDETTASGSKKREDMERRVALGEEIGADMVLSIHMNEYRDRSQSGPQVFYRQESDESRLLAGCMQAALISVLSPPKERAALAGDYFILRLPVPSVLIECGFISNSAEEKLLLDSAYQARLGEAIAQGVMDYLSLEARRSATPG